MSYYRVRKSTLGGTITVPPSKSHTLRALLFGALGVGRSTIHHYLPSPDTQAMIAACRLFGATVSPLPDRVEIEGIGGVVRHAEDVIHAGNSGIVLRFCTAVGALAPHPVVVTGDDSIRHQRPMKPLLDGLSQLGVSVCSMRGDLYAPVIVQGPMRAGKARIPGHDSQPVSALLIAAAFAEAPIEIEVHDVGEKPWIALTLDWFDRLGIAYEQRKFSSFWLPGRSRYPGFAYAVPGDFSSAAFPIACALVTQSELVVTNLDMRDAQGDKELIALFQKMGAAIEIDQDAQSLRVKKGKGLSGVTVDINNFIDAITILAVVACFAEGETRIVNARVAAQKECNRIHCIATELQKMGADIAKTEDGLIIRGSALRGAALHSYHDHRMLMSLTVAALGAEGESVISDTECVSKTFPTFASDFRAIGAEIQEEI